MKNRNLQLLIVLAITLGGCNYMNSLTLDDDTTSKSIALEAFDHVIIETSVKLILKNDSVTRATVVGPAFVVSKIQTTQKGKTIHVEAGGNGFRKKQLAQVTLYSPTFKTLTCNWPAEIETRDTLKVNDLMIVINGRGAFSSSNVTIKAKRLALNAYGSNVGTHTFKGQVDNFNVVSEGLTAINARELIAARVKYIQRSVNAGYVHATDILEVEMASSGNIYFEGTPHENFIPKPPAYKVELGKVLEYRTQNNDE